MKTMNVALWLVLATSGSPSAEPVAALMEAFNAHDVERMLAVCTDDIKWMMVGADGMSVEADGAQALRDGMAGYFEAIPSARSKLRTSSSSGPFVLTVEEASWESGGERKNQCSAAVYEVREAKVRNVWYFPAHACDAEKPASRQAR